MQIKEFIKEVEKELNISLELKPAPSDSTMCGIYYDGCYITAAPSGVIKNEHDEGYTNERGYPHRPSTYVKAKIVDFVEKYKDPNFKALVNEKIII